MVIKIEVYDSNGRESDKFLLLDVSEFDMLIDRMMDSFHFHAKIDDYRTITLDLINGAFHINVYELHLCDETVIISEDNVNALIGAYKDIMETLLHFNLTKYS